MFSPSGTPIQFNQNPHNLHKLPLQINAENAVGYGPHTCLVTQISGSRLRTCLVSAFGESACFGKVQSFDVTHKSMENATTFADN